MAQPVADLPPMAEAIAQIEPDLILREAKRQYEALVCMRHAQADIPLPVSASQKHHAVRAQQRIDLAQHYRNLFNTATAALGKWDKRRLLTICFAYKTKADVSHFLDLLNESVFPWIAPLKDIVHKYAKDTAFKDATTETNVCGENEEADGAHSLAILRQQGAAKGEEKVNSCGGALLGTALPSLANSRSPYRLRSEAALAKAIPIEYPGPYFVITTLPLAFPSMFFNSFASHAPINALTVQSLLSYSAAMQLTISETVTEVLRNNFPNSRKRNLSSSLNISHAQSRQIAQEEASWAALFKHLLQNRETLTLCDSKEFTIGEGEDGYKEIDLGMWLAVWRAERQSVGNKEKGQETLLRMKPGLGNAAAAQGVADEMDIGGGIALVPRSRKRVSWNEEELVMVKEIPSRERKRRKKPENNS